MLRRTSVLRVVGLLAALALARGCVEPEDPNDTGGETGGTPATDTPDKLDFPKLERVARLAFLIGYRNAMRPEKPEAIGSQKDWFDEKDH